MADSTQRQPDGRFKKGHRRIIGRVKGEPNKISRSLREGILDAAIEHGSDGNGKDGLKGCASWLLREHTKSFMPLLVRLLPLQVSGEVNHRTTKLVVNVQSIPRGSFFDANGVLRPPRDRCIEHSVDEVAAVTIDEVNRAEDQSPIAATPTPGIQLCINNNGDDTAA